jgi:hypothetical protein
MLESSSQNTVLDFLSAVKHTASVDDAWTLTKSFMSDNGASHVGIKLGLDTTEPLFLWSAPQWVSSMYMETVYPDKRSTAEVFP